MSYWPGGKPILLTLNYSGCPGLCVAQLDGLVRGVEELRDVWLGEDFQLVSISIDPRETAGRAKKTKDRYTKHSRKSIDNSGLGISGRVVPMPLVASLTRVGFRYSYDKANDRYTTWPWRLPYRPKERLLVIYMT